MNSESLKKIMIFIILIAFLGFISCTTEEEEEETAVTTELEGSWETGCKTSTDENGDPEYSIEIDTYPENSFTVLETRYEESTCITKIFEVKSATTFVIGDFVAGVDGAKKIDFTISEITFTPLDAGLVSIFNQNTVFGISDWAINTPRSILGNEVDDGCGVINTGHVFYYIFKIDADKLYYGDESGTSCSRYSEASRPTALDTDYFTKL